jgi:predicted metal-dependent hydrolase
MKIKKKILFICRNTEHCQLIKNELQALEMEVYLISTTEVADIKKLAERGLNCIMISLQYAPSMGRDIGIYLRKYKLTRHVPMIFLNGNEEAVAGVRKLLPDAFYICQDELKNQLPSIIEVRNETPVIPDTIFEAYKDVPLEKKLGLIKGMRILIVNSPLDFTEKFNEYNLNFVEEISKNNDMIFWFLSTQEQISDQLHHILPVIGKGGIWMFWQKKQPKWIPYFNEVMVRKLGMDNGLVDYKICSVDSEWTGLKFSIRKKPKIEKDAKGTKHEIQASLLVTNISFINDKPVIVLDDQLIPIEIHHDKRKNMQLILKKEPKLVVMSPRGLDEEKVLQVVFSRMKWIIKRMKHLDELNPYPSKFTYTDGEKHLYFGKEYEIRLKEAKKVNVKFSDPYLEVEVPDIHNAKQVREALWQWYAEQTAEYISQRAWYFIHQYVSEKMHKKIEFKFRKMKSRWGSCSSKGLITFNKDLIRAPKEAIDYLIVHELCHLKHHNHGEDFYKELSRIIPDWKIRRKMLARISL